MLKPKNESGEKNAKKQHRKAKACGVIIPVLIFRNLTTWINRKQVNVSIHPNRIQKYEHRPDSLNQQSYRVAK